MNRDRELQILEASLGLALEARRPLGAEETSVPTSDYVDPDRFQRELEVFRRSYLLVGLSTDLAEPGAFLTADVMGSPVLVVRGEDGVLRAFLNVCRHRGATVELRRAGRCKRFVCPYHAWTYGDDGSLRKVRHAEGFPTLRPEGHGLVELPCTEAAGLLFVCPTPGAAPEPLPFALLAELGSVVGPRPLAVASTGRTWRMNWKLLVEGGIESYHFRVAHKDTIAPFFTDTQSTHERIGHHIRSVLPKRSITSLADVPRDQWHLRDHTHVVYSLHPNAVILLQRTHFDLLLMRPLAPDSTHIEVITVGSAPTEGELSDRARAYLEQNHAISVRTLDEDFVLGEQIQRGIATGANTHFRFGRFEDALTDWHRGLDALVRGGSP
ncbi:MAG: Rieske 2Fe-2S domain-containing protein [Alphaproteobacteria bacterium]|nr:Rieske 2Fe-2S domain-containing protein [Alphaproteobacteria bacterium]